MIDLNSRLPIYIVSFLEGGVLMGFEILSSKIYTPYLGSSIYVWTSILSVTLAGLAAGYHLGGKWAENDPQKKLMRSLVFAGIFLTLINLIAPTILTGLLSIDVKTASFLGGLMILFLPVTALGTVSPLLVSILNQRGVPLGNATGMIYGIGTFGGIVILLLTTFLLIPELGVNISTWIMSGLVLIASLIVFFKLKDHAK